jgi:Pyruvate/2-oxoacid:ferredoxin oxidoreductase delta subunit
MGMTIAEIIEEIGGGPENGVPIKAVQTGGPSGGCIPASQFDLPVSYDSLVEAGSIMGSGGMIVMDQTTCMVDVAKYFMTFMKDESCGKCFVCRKGTQRMYEILDDISKGRASLQQLSLLEELAVVVRDTSLCGLGQTAPNTVLGTLRHFRGEYLAHIEAHKCPAHVCRELNTYRIDPEICVQKGHGCGACRRACPETAIFGEQKHSHRIDADLCRKCGVCLDVCNFNAVIVE